MGTLEDHQPTTSLAWRSNDFGDPPQNQLLTTAVTRRLKPQRTHNFEPSQTRAVQRLDHSKPLNLTLPAQKQVTSEDVHAKMTR